MGGVDEGDDRARWHDSGLPFVDQHIDKDISCCGAVSTEVVLSSGNWSEKRGFAIAKRLRNWSFSRKIPVVEQPKCGTKNIPRIFRRNQTSSGLPPVNSCFCSIWKWFQIDPLCHHGDHPPWILLRQIAFNNKWKVSRHQIQRSDHEETSLLIWWNLQFWWNRIRNRNPQKIAQWYLFKVNRLWTNQSINQSIKHLMFDTDIEERGLKRKGRAAAAASLNPSEFSSTILCFFNSSRSSCGCWDCAPSSTAADVLSLVLHLSQLQLISWTAYKHFGNFSKETKVFKHQ